VQAEILAIKVSGHVITCGLSDGLNTWTVPAVPAGFSHTEIACVGKMWIFIRSNICILHVYKSSAVAEMGDRLATVGIGQNWRGAAVGGCVPI